MTKNASFKLNYAPHLNTFENLAGADPLGQLQFMADNGFRALEDSGPAHPNFPGRLGIGMLLQTNTLVTRIGEKMTNLGMEMGTLSLGPVLWPLQPSLTSGNPAGETYFWIVVA